MDKNVILFEKRNDTLETIYKLYNRTETGLLEDVKTLKNWMLTQPHFPEILDDKMIENFFILNKCSIERTKEKIDNYYSLRSVVSDIYANINPKLPNMKEFMKIAYCVPLPKLTKENYRVIVFKMRNQNMIDLMEPHNVIGHINNIQEMRLKEDVMFGDIMVYDCEGINFGYITKLTPTVLARVFTIYEKVYSIPLKGMYAINSPPFINAVLTIIKALMKPKLFQRIKVCPDKSLLNEDFPLEMLPEDYGGQEKSLEELQHLLQVKFDQYRDRFDTLDQLKVNEKLRPDKLQNDELLGFHGNFKQLVLD